MDDKKTITKTINKIKNEIIDERLLFISDGAKNSKTKFHSITTENSVVVKIDIKTAKKLSNRAKRLLEIDYLIENNEY